MKRLMVGVGVVCAITATGCTSSSSGGAPTPTTSVAPTASVQQYASVIAEYEGDFQQADDQYTNRCPLSVPVGACGLALLDVAQAATHLAKALQAAETTLGPPPSEITQLVASTLKHAVAIETAYGVFKHGQPIEQRTAPLVFPEYNLRHDLLGWKPYVG